MLQLEALAQRGAMHISSCEFNITVWAFKAHCIQNQNDIHVCCYHSYMNSAPYIFNPMHIQFCKILNIVNV